MDYVIPRYDQRCVHVHIQLSNLARISSGKQLSLLLLVYTFSSPPWQTKLSLPLLPCSTTNSLIMSNRNLSCHRTPCNDCSILRRSPEPSLRCSIVSNRPLSWTPRKWHGVCERKSWGYASDQLKRPRLFIEIVVNSAIFSWSTTTPPRRTQSPYLSSVAKGIFLGVDVREVLERACTKASISEEEAPSGLVADGGMHASTSKRTTNFKPLRFYPIWVLVIIVCNLKWAHTYATILWWPVLSWQYDGCVVVATSKLNP